MVSDEVGRGNISTGWIFSGSGRMPMTEYRGPGKLVYISLVYISLHEASILLPWVDQKPFVDKPCEYQNLANRCWHRQHRLVRDPILIDPRRYPLGIEMCV